MVRASNLPPESRWFEPGCFLKQETLLNVVSLSTRVYTGDIMLGGNLSMD